MAGGGGGGGSARGEVGPCAACCTEAKSTCNRCGTAKYCSRACQSSHWPFHRKVCSTGGGDPARRGVVGCVNLGNSCYMNSALACLSHVFPVTRHLISGM